MVAKVKARADWKRPAPTAADDGNYKSKTVALCLVLLTVNRQILYESAYISMLEKLHNGGSHAAGNFEWRRNMAREFRGRKVGGVDKDSKKMRSWSETKHLEVSLVEILELATNESEDLSRTKEMYIKARMQTATS